MLANARMLGASRRQLLTSVYLPSALSWVFSSLHTAVGFAAPMEGSAVRLTAGRMQASAETISQRAFGATPTSVREPSR